MKKYYIDTNIFLRALVVEEKNQSQQCINFLNKVKNNQVRAVTGNIVIAEAAWVLKSYYKFSKEKIVELIKSIINLRGLIIEDKLNIRKGLEIFANENIKYIDALIASIKPIQEKKWTVVSFDKDFDKIGVIRKEPGQI
ncbi:PIN domain-containing protein [Microgenomates group bacterium]|nr:PIN domain-containing protein [Microgenomates group bacterium]